MKKKLSLSLSIALIVGSVLGPATRSNALVSSFDTLNFKPAVYSTQFITVYDADTHATVEWNGGFYVDWAHHPLELGAPIGTRSAGVIDDTIVLNLIGSYGFTNWFEAGARVPVVLWNNYQGLTTALGGPVPPARPNAEND